MNHKYKSISPSHSHTHIHTHSHTHTHIYIYIYIYIYLFIYLFVHTYVKLISVVLLKCQIWKHAESLENKFLKLIFVYSSDESARRKIHYIST